MTSFLTGAPPPKKNPGSTPTSVIQLLFVVVVVVSFGFICFVFVSFPQKRNGIVFSSGVNYLHSGGNIQSE